MKLSILWPTLGGRGRSRALGGEEDQGRGKLSPLLENSLLELAHR